jgi:hypothetical protein
MLARLRALRSNLIDSTIAVHHRRIVKRTGDGSRRRERQVVEDGQIPRRNCAKSRECRYCG